MHKWDDQENQTKDQYTVRHAVWKEWYAISLMIHCKKKDNQPCKIQSYAMKMLQKNSSNLHMKIFCFTDMPLLKFTQENLLEKRDLKKAISSQQIKSHICCNYFKIITFQTYKDGVWSPPSLYTIEMLRVSSMKINEMYSAASLMS